MHWVALASEWRGDSVVSYFRPGRGIAWAGRLAGAGLLSRGPGHDPQATGDDDDDGDLGLEVGHRPHSSSIAPPAPEPPPPSSGLPVATRASCAEANGGCGSSELYTCTDRPGQ